MEADGGGVGHGRDLDDPLVEQPLHPLAGGRLREAHGPGDGRVGPPAVLLELLDDPLAELVEAAPAVPDRRSRLAGVVDLTDRGVSRPHNHGF